MVRSKVYEYVLATLIVALFLYASTMEYNQITNGVVSAESRGVD